MNILQPSRLTFWRFLFIFGTGLSFFAIYQIFGKGRALGVDFAASRAWMGLVTAFGLFGLFLLLLFALTWSPYREQLLSLTDIPERIPNSLRWIGILLLGVAIVGFTRAFMIPIMGSFISGLGAVHSLVFLSFSLLGMWGIKMLRRETSWFIAFLAIVLF